MSEIVNLLVNNGVAVVIVAYFIYKDNKFNNTLVETLTEIVVTLKDLQKDIERSKNIERTNTEMLTNDKAI
jgi:hypothetical protein